MRRLERATVVAELYGVPVRRIWEGVRTGLFPRGVYLRLGRQVFFDLGALEEFHKRGGSAGLPSQEKEK
jgi:hypothetical protein